MKTDIRVSIALQETDVPSFLTLVDGDSVAAGGGKHCRLSVTQVLVEGNAKQGLPMVLLQVRAVNKQKRLVGVVFHLKTAYEHE